MPKQSKQSRKHRRQLATRPMEEKINAMSRQQRKAAKRRAEKNKK